MRLAQSSPRSRASFNQSWSFFRGDAPDAGSALGRERLAPWRLASGAEWVAAGGRVVKRRLEEPAPGLSFIQPSFDDSGWRTLDLPHDWGIEGPFSQDLPGETGKLPWAGVAWYRKRFRLHRQDRTSLVELHLDGAMAFSAIWLNGMWVGGWPYGYTSFRVDLTPHSRFGAENVLAVRLDNPERSSRWYPGSGLYRNTWLVKSAPTRMSHQGTFVTTPRVSAESAWVNVDVGVENMSDGKAALSLQTSLHALMTDGAVGAQLFSSKPTLLELVPREHAQRSHGFSVSTPRLWSIDQPERYVAVIQLTRKGRLVDRVEQPFGIRRLRLDATQGLFLNERPVRINGVCMHHDLGALGAAVSRRAIERQVEILKDMGCNAIRTAHNPPAPELLETCDRLGMLVMVEAFDCWQRGKKWAKGSAEHALDIQYLDYASVFDDWHEIDLRAMVRRDRNHPSVAFWSIGNEVIEQALPDGFKLARRLAGIVREEDRSRPITSGLNVESASYSGFESALDVVGYNYKPAAYAGFHQSHPHIPVLGAETASTVSSRGEYFFPVSNDPSKGRVDYQVSSYDLYAPAWAFTPDREFRGLDEAPFVIGEFVWTGFDYLGEPTPYAADSSTLLEFSDPAARARAVASLAARGAIDVPSRSSYFGILDLAGFPKDRFYLYQSRWRPELRAAHILPHWNWPERVGRVTPVHVYAAADEAELFLNGQSQGRRSRKPHEYRFRWNEVRYAPGVLSVVTYRNGKKWAVGTRETAGEATRVGLAADRKRLSADGQDLAFVKVAIRDQRGRDVPRTGPLIAFSLTGPGDIIAVDNGDPTSLEPFQADQRRAFNGLCLVIVRARRGRGGPLVLTARSHGLARATLNMESLPGAIG